MRIQPPHAGRLYHKVLLKEYPFMTTQSAALTPTKAAERPRGRTLQETQRLWGWIFLSPWIFGFLAFTFFPMAASLYFSFTDFQIGKPRSWVGLQNWQNLFTDP